MNTAPETKPMSTLEQALALAARGFHVFPLIANGRVPAIGAFPQRATTDPEAIRRWWIEHDPVLGVTREKDYNVAIYTGRYGDGKALLVVDVDVKKGKHGEEELAKLDMFDGVPPTLTASTPSGGRHLFYQIEEPLKSGVNVLGNGLDTRSGGGFVVAVGSVIDGRTYRWISDSPVIAPAPAWMKDRVGKPAERPERGQVIELLDTKPAVDRAVSYLAGPAPQAVEGSGGDAITFRVAAAVKDFGLSELTALELMWQHWNLRQAPPWDYEALATKVANAYHYGNQPVGVRDPHAAGFDVVPVEKEDYDEAFPDPKQRTVADLHFADIDDFDEETLAVYNWLIGNLICRSYVTAIIAAPAVGKSLFCLLLAFAMASARRDTIGADIHDPGNVLVINNEDDNADLRKRWAALRRLHGASSIHHVTIKGGAANPMRLAYKGSDGLVKATPDADLVKQFILANNVKLAVFDPLVEFHNADENDNAQMNAVVAVLRNIAIECDCAVVIVHHTRKPPAGSSDGHRGNLDSARGGSSFGGNVRRAFTLFEMSEHDAVNFCVDPKLRHRYIVLDDAKASHTEKGTEARWFCKEGVRLKNGESIAALRPVRDGELRKRDAELGTLVAEHIIRYAKDADRAVFSLNEVGRLLVIDPMFSDEKKVSGEPKTKFMDSVFDALLSGAQVGTAIVKSFGGQKVMNGTTVKRWVEVSVTADPGLTPVTEDE